MTKIIGIVDPFCPGLLGKAFFELGYQVIQINSNSTISRSAGFAYSTNHYAQFLNADLDKLALMKQLEKIGTSAIVTGCETGVELTDELTKALNLKGNLPAFSTARRHKYEMAKRAKQCRLKTPHQYDTASLKSIIQWAREFDVFPVIVKPPKSIGSDNIHRCHTLKEVERAFLKIYGQTNKLGAKNESVLIQEYLVGKEFAIDTVSWEGQHKVTAFWEYGRQAKSTFLNYDSMAIMPADGKIQRLLKDYVFRLLTALKIDFGPAHTELFYVNDELYLMEIGARMQGGRGSIIARHCTGSSQLDETVLAYDNPQLFLKNVEQPYQLKKHDVNLFLRPNQPGILKKINHLNKIKQLPSFHKMWISEVGNYIPKFAGNVILIHEDKNVINRDRQVIRGFENNDMFEINIGNPH